MILIMNAPYVFAVDVAEFQVAVQFKEWVLGNREKVIDFIVIGVCFILSVSKT